MAHMSPSKGDRPGKKRKRAAPKPTQHGVADDLPAELRAAVEPAERTGSTVSAGSRKPGSGAGTTPPDRPPLDDACQKLIELVRQRCPGLLPAAPLEPGGVAAPIPLQPKEAAALMSIAARQAVLTAAGARVPSDARRLPAAVLWQDGADALLVEVGQIDVQLADGLVSVAIPVRCDQLPKGRGVAVVDLVLGTPARPTGMLAAATEPRGPRIVVSRWGEALTALAWQALLDTAGGVAAVAGADHDGAVLIPTGLTASRAGIAVVAQARHELDRIRPGQVVLAPRAQVSSS
jgi:hypothetical protein